MLQSLFQLQVPVYWRHCYKDPDQDNFNDHFIVTKSTKDLLQRLVHACCEASSAQSKFLNLKTARRVECAPFWRDYTRSRKGLLNGLKGTASFETPNQLDGKHESGHVITHSHLQSEATTENCISVSNLDASINEFLLWFGTSKGAADGIAKGEFTLFEDDQSMPFGQGGYFTEQLDKALEYARMEGVLSGEPSKYVLLCRVLCGDILYTESMARPGCVQTARNKNKHSVLANPSGKGPREFIQPEVNYVYPEYILELSSRSTG